MKIIQSNHRFSKNFAINQSESSITYKEIIIFSDINQSETSFIGHGIFNKLNDNQSEISSTSHGFFNNFDIVVDIEHSFTGSFYGNNQSEGSIGRF